MASDKEAIFNATILQLTTMINNELQEKKANSPQHQQNLQQQNQQQTEQRLNQQLSSKIDNEQQHQKQQPDQSPQRDQHQQKKHPPTISGPRPGSSLDLALQQVWPRNKPGLDDFKAPHQPCPPPALPSHPRLRYLPAPQID